MKIIRPQTIRAEMDLANRVKNELLRVIQERIKSANESEWLADRLQELYDELNAVSEFFKVSLKRSNYKKVDRCCSMFSGPFFISNAFPEPGYESGQMFPVIQFDLSILSKALNSKMGSGLLQVWYDLSGEKELIRVIPMEAVKPDFLIDYQVSGLEDEEYSFPLPFWLEKDPVMNGVSVISSMTSCGIDYDNQLVDNYGDLFDEDEDWLNTLLKVFGKISSDKDRSSLMVGGSLHAVQYTYSEVKMRQLLKIHDWGSTGRAEIFFKTQQDKESPLQNSFQASIQR